MANKDNHRFYDDMADDRLHSAALSVGLIPPIDVDTVLREIDYNPASVLEVGAGRGRVTDALLERLPQTRIFAVERSPPSVGFLRGRYAAHDRVSIVEGDIASVELFRVDLTLWLWSGIADFAPCEQGRVLARLAECTARTIVIETPVEGAATLATSVEGQWHVFRESSGEYRGYVPRGDEIAEIACADDLALRRVEYSTHTGRYRVLYFLERAAQAL